MTISAGAMVTVKPNRRNALGRPRPCSPREHVKESMR